MSNKLLLSVAITSALISGQALAHDKNFQTNSCDMELDGHIQYYQGDLTVTMDNGSVMSIDAQHNMTVNGEAVSLNREQKKWVGEYYDNIDMAIPMTLNIASEGLEIANVAVTEVFTELLGGDQMGDDFRELFDSLDAKLNKEFGDSLTEHEARAIMFSFNLAPVWRSSSSGAPVYAPYESSCASCRNLLSKSAVDEAPREARLLAS